MPSDAGQWAAIAGVIVAMVVQVIAIAFFLGRLFERQNGQHQRIKKLEDRDAVETNSAGALTLAVARLEISMTHLTSDVSAIKSRLG